MSGIGSGKKYACMVAGLQHYPKCIFKILILSVQIGRNTKL